MARKLPKWEEQLWSYLTTGNGMRCPLLNCCTSMLRSEWCADTNLTKLNLLIASDGQFDPDSFDRIRPCGEGVMPYVERLAEQQLRRGKVAAIPVPTDLVQLAGEGHPVEVRPLDLRACYAATWRLQDGWVIQIPDTASPSHNRFALFHEAFHIIAHSRCQSPVFSKRGANQGSFNELLADYFAICVLMPREQVREKWVEAKDLKKMADTFEVPKSTMWLRLREMDLVD
ncbi:MAG: ImmA/IrrE family metallo-endopeptidase [Dehalococcoidales bacterium]|nr:MAG: ImmA/IrrE family metallo-endopeptidase [Dehalococcoidales bacterium]